MQHSSKVEANQNTAFDRRCISRQKHKRAKPFGWTWALKRSWKLTCLRIGCSLSHFSLLNEGSICNSNSSFHLPSPSLLRTGHVFLVTVQPLVKLIEVQPTWDVPLKIWKFVIVTFRKRVEREKPPSFVYFCPKGCKILGHYWLWCGAQEAPWHLTLNQSCAAFVLIIEIA